MSHEVAADKLNEPLSLSNFVIAVTEELNGERNMDVIRSYMQRYDVASNEWKRYAFWSGDKMYTRNLIATDSANFTLMLVCWNPHKASPIHNHPNSECFMRVIQGELIESRYEIAEAIGNRNVVKLNAQNFIKEGDVLFINDSIGCHKMENSGDIGACTLHLYIPPYESCRCYNESGESCFAYPTFFSEHGELVSGEENL